jgi:hypothetical protein
VIDRGGIDGVVDMGGYLLVMTGGGLRRFDGNSFDSVPLTMKVNDILGTDLLNAQMTVSDDYVYIITETSRALNKLITIKHSDGSFACGIDLIDTTIEIMDCMAFVPNLKNFGNTSDDSNFILGIHRTYNTVGPALKYFLSEYDLSGQNYDLLISTADASTNKPIVAQISPAIIDSGTDKVMAVRKISAYISSLGDTGADFNSPSGKFLIKTFGNFAPDGSAEFYDEKIMEEVLKKNPTLTYGNGDPLQGKPTKVFSVTNTNQTGGVMSNSDNNAAVAAYVKQEWLVEFSMQAWMRLWKIIFEYGSINNFEFNGFGVIFVRKDTQP